VRPIERALADLWRSDPPAELRARILTAVRAEWATGRARPAPASLWRFAAGLAAGVLLFVNLSMSAANHAATFMPPPRDGDAIRQAIRLRAALADESREVPWESP
jgi:hypothetical protein